MMKTPEQILKELNWSHDSDPGRFDLFSGLIKPAIEIAQIEAYNEAVELAANVADVIRPDYAPFVKEPILKLKKSVSITD